MKTKHFVWLILFCTIGMTTTLSCSEKRGELRRIWYKGSYNRDFNDLNPLHIEAATRLGIDPVSSREEAERASRKMVEIKTNKYYEVEELTHSIPYLVPEAATLLETIGKNFIDSLKSHNASLYQVKVTSVTRTVDDISKLQKRNINSSSNSAHLYGTTFDISWVRYAKTDEKDTLNISQEDLKMVLAMVLRDLQKQEKCYVKHERKQGCFHITAR
ncbi:DUF5715 family protein [Parabacteroides sp. OttesenSCG-928-G06]|nr:DUF5715 family protein [Parabacteroides sp. OttesenSCG-928-K15]MDL2282183.1 DUF5715 family protein [Parabacteroides sp. OttesenSCG-928-G06]